MFSSIKSALAGQHGPEASAPSFSGPECPPAIPDYRAQKLTVGGYEIEGVSISGQETCIIVPRAKVVFDIGRCPQRAVNQQTVLISHGHLDHMGGVPFHVASRNLAAAAPSKLVVHPNYIEGIKAYIESANALQGNPPCPYEVSGLEESQELALPSGFLCRPFPTVHRITSQGYLLYSVRKKLRADLQGHTQDEIKAMRLSGEEVQEVQQVPEIAFTGDTTAEFLNSDHPSIEHVLKARLLIMEMTFLDDSVTVDEAREKGHFHIADFIAHAHRFQNEAILLIHFSPRYKRSEIINNLNTWLPPALKAKVVPLLNGYTG